MSSQLAERLISPLRGVQTPRIEECPPESNTVQADLVIEFCEAAGLFLDPWQKIWLTHGLAEQKPGKWSAFEIASVVSRQNGKGEVLLARELGGMYLLGEKIQIHSAHQFKTCREAFLKMKRVVQSSPLLEGQIKAIRNANGEESIELRNGARLQYVARSNNSGRGFTGDLIVFDEAQILGNGPVEDMMPTLSTKPQAQVWYAGTTGTTESVYLARLRRRAQKGNAGRLAYMEWSVDEDDYDPASRADWARANPALGIRISEEYVEDERQAMTADGFARERLSVGKWPADIDNRVIRADDWDGCGDARGDRPRDPVCFGLDTNLERSQVDIAVAGRRADGMLAVELADQRPGLDWVVARVVELDSKWAPLGWVVDAGGPAGTLVPLLEGAGVNVLVPSSREVTQASEGFYDVVIDGTLRHTEDRRLSTAVAGAEKKIFPDGAWMWSRRSSSTDITPLMAASFAVWGYRMQTDRFGDGLRPDDITVL